MEHSFCVGTSKTLQELLAALQSKTYKKIEGIGLGRRSSVQNAPTALTCLEARQVGAPRREPCGVGHRLRHRFSERQAVLALGAASILQAEPSPGGPSSMQSRDVRYLFLVFTIDFMVIVVVIVILRGYGRFQRCHRDCYCYC